MNEIEMKLKENEMQITEENITNLLVNMLWIFCSLDCSWDFQELHEEVKEVLAPSHKLKAKGIKAGEAKLPFVEKAFAVRNWSHPFHIFWGYIILQPHWISMHLKALLVGCGSAQSNQLPSAANEKGERDLQVLVVNHCSSFL